jgi:hypothetical protein
MAAAHACQLNSLDDVLVSVIVFRDDTGIIGAKLHCPFSSVICHRQPQDDLSQLHVGAIIFPFHARKGKENWFNANKLMKKIMYKRYYFDKSLFSQISNSYNMINSSYQGHRRR